MRSGLILTIVLVASLAAPAANAAATDADVREAIVSAVRTKLGVAADIRVEELQVRGVVESRVTATPAPGAKTGTRIHFSLRSVDGVTSRFAEADALVFVAAPHFRALHPMRRGTPMTNDLVAEQRGDVGSVALQPLPKGRSLTGSAAARDISEGEVLTAALVTAAVLVKPGDKVLVTVKSAAVQVQATLVAAQAGGLGDIVRCVNPETRKAMSARVIGPGIAEAIHAF